jgi:hypothetical protein
VTVVTLLGGFGVSFITGCYWQVPPIQFRLFLPGGTGGPPTGESLFLDNL